MLWNWSGVSEVDAWSFALGHPAFRKLIHGDHFRCDILTCVGGCSGMGVLVFRSQPFAEIQEGWAYHRHDLGRLRCLSASWDHHDRTMDDGPYVEVVVPGIRG